MIELQAALDAFKAKQRSDHAAFLKANQTPGLAQRVPEAAIRRSRFPAMAPMAETAPIGAIPEEPRVAAMSLNVINIRRLAAHAGLEAVGAERMLREVLLARPPPGVTVAARSGAPPWRRSRSLPARRRVMHGRSHRHGSGPMIKRRFDGRMIKRRFDGRMIKRRFDGRMIR